MYEYPTDEPKLTDDGVVIVKLNYKPTDEPPIQTQIPTTPVAPTIPSITPAFVQSNVFSGYWYSGLFVNPKAWNTISKEDWDIMTPYTHLHYCYIDFSENPFEDNFDSSKLYTNGALIVSDGQINKENTVQNNFVPMFQIKKNCKHYNKKFIFVFKDCKNAPTFIEDSDDGMCTSILKNIIELRNFIGFDGVDFYWNMSYGNINKFLFLGRLCLMLRETYPKDFDIFISIDLDQVYPTFQTPIIALTEGMKYDKNNDTRNAYINKYEFPEQKLDKKTLFSIVNNIHIVGNETIDVSWEDIIYRNIEANFEISGKFTVDLPKTVEFIPKNKYGYSVFYFNKPMRTCEPNQQEEMLKLYICNKLIENNQGKCLFFGGEFVGSFRNWDFKTIRENDCDGICLETKENYFPSKSRSYHWRYILVFIVGLILLFCNKKIK